MLTSGRLGLMDPCGINGMHAWTRRHDTEGNVLEARHVDAESSGVLPSSPKWIPFSDGSSTPCLISPRLGQGNSVTIGHSLKLGKHVGVGGGRSGDWELQGIDCTCISSAFQQRLIEDSLRLMSCFRA